MFMCYCTVAFGGAVFNSACMCLHFFADLHIRCLLRFTWGDELWHFRPGRLFLRLSKLELDQGLNNDWIRLPVPKVERKTVLATSRKVQFCANSTISGNPLFCHPWGRLSQKDFACRGRPSESKHCSYPGTCWLDLRPWSAEPRRSMPTMHVIAL